MTNSSHLSEAWESLGGRLLSKASGREVPLCPAHHGRLCIWQNAGRNTQLLEIRYLWNDLPQGIKLTLDLRWITLYSTIHFHQGHNIFKRFCSQLHGKKLKRHLSLRQLGTLLDIFSWEVHKRVQQRCYKEKQAVNQVDLQETYPLFLLNEKHIGCSELLGIV